MENCSSNAGIFLQHSNMLSLIPKEKKGPRNQKSFFFKFLKKNDDDIFDRMLEIVFLSFILGIWGQICSFSPLLPQQQLFSFPLIFFAFAFDYLFTLLYIPNSVYPCFPEYCRYSRNIVFAKNCIKIKGIIPRLEEADFVYRYSWFITRYKNLVF